MDGGLADDVRRMADELEADQQRALAAIRAIADRIEAMEHSLADAGADGAATEPAALVVPYRSQWEADALKFQSDCGPACVAMLVQARTGKRLPIDQISVECGMSDARHNTFPDDLIRGAAAHGVGLACLIVSSVVMARTPFVVLVHYESLPRMDQGYTRGHWVVVTRVDDGQATYHDPDWWGTRIGEGESRRVTVDEMDRALRDCALDGNPAGLALVLKAEG